MCDHALLMETFAEHRKVHDRFLEMFGTLFETAQSMKLLAADITSNYDALFLQLRKQSSPVVEQPPQKRRKAHSFDSPSTARPNATSTGRCVDDAIDSSMVRNKSDPEVSTYSLLNQAIDLPDSEESFFALTQSPPTVREPLSPRRDLPGQADNVPSTPPKLDSTEKKRKKHNLSLGRFSTNFQMSPETNKQLQQLPVRQKMTTPKVKVEQQENLAPVGKWTAKKSSTGVGRSESSAVLRRTPTSTGKDSTGSLLNRTRLRQTKLRFPDNKSSAADDDETYFDEFVVPSPTSFSGSRFFKSMRKKEQSSLIAAAPSSSTATTSNNPAQKEDDDVFKSPEAKPRKAVKPAVDSDEDNFDIDQTYFSEAEKDLSRGTKVVRVKQEPSSQKKLTKSKILALDTPALEQGILDASGVEIVKPPSQDNVITIEESQPTRNDLFMEAIREEQRREQASRKTILDAMGPPTIRKPPEFRSSPLRKFNTFGGVGPLVPKPAPPPERRCTECTKHTRILELRGLTPDEIRAKLARNCRGCRQAQLHETPPGFWNPEFSPTQRI
ncbi:hypothetical protein quinque_006372 [Culex quinquefasciatus]